MFVYPWLTFTFVRPRFGTIKDFIQNHSDVFIVDKDINVLLQSVRRQPQRDANHQEEEEEEQKSFDNHKSAGQHKETVPKVQRGRKQSGASRVNENVSTSSSHWFIHVAALLALAAIFAGFSLNSFSDARFEQAKRAVNEVLTHVLNDSKKLVDYFWSQMQLKK
jgi:hypothetical protein